MGQTLFTNVKIFDGNAKRSYAGEVLLQGNMVKKAAKGQRKIKAVGATVIDGAGATLMPGLVEAHSHVCYNNCATLADIGRLPPEEHMLLAVDNAKLMLDQGFNQPVFRRRRRLAEAPHRAGVA
jgi:imidazolonepropionase-like amidohydrolase